MSGQHTGADDDDLCELCHGCGEVQASTQRDDRDLIACPLCVSVEKNAIIAETAAERDRLRAEVERWELSAHSMANVQLSEENDALINERDGLRADLEQRDYQDAIAAKLIERWEKDVAVAEVRVEALRAINAELVAALRGMLVARDKIACERARAVLAKAVQS